MVSSLGVSTCGELYERRGLLAALFSPVSLEFFLEAALGLGEARVGGTAMKAAARRVPTRLNSACHSKARGLGPLCEVCTRFRWTPPNTCQPRPATPGPTRHADARTEGEPGRKGISCERTFGAISNPKQLADTVGALGSIKGRS
jgi:hypothetical protein